MMVLLPVFVSMLAVSARAAPFRYPLPADKGTVTAYFDHSGKDWNCGTMRYSGHKGSDFGVGKGTPIYAAAAGTVVYVNDGCADTCTTGSCGCGGGFGNYVKLQHADGNHTYYAHMEIWSVAVQVGQNVSCGQPLGAVASSGNSTGNHLHFEVRVPTTSEDPFAGPCSGSTSRWAQQGPYLGRPGTSCALPPPDAAPPKPDAPPPTPDLAPLPKDSGLPPNDGVRGDVAGPADLTLAGSDLPSPWQTSPAGRTLSGGCTIGAGPLDAAWLLLLVLGLGLGCGRALTRSRGRRRP